MFPGSAVAGERLGAGRERRIERTRLAQPLHPRVGLTAALLQQRQIERQSSRHRRGQPGARLGLQQLLVGRHTVLGHGASLGRVGQSSQMHHAVGRIELADLLQGPRHGRGRRLAFLRSELGHRHHRAPALRVLGRELGRQQRQLDRSLETVGVGHRGVGHQLHRRAAPRGAEPSRGVKLEQVVRGGEQPGHRRKDRAKHHSSECTGASLTLLARKR